MKKNHLILCLAAVLMAICVSLPNALAYFTTYVRASGGRSLKLEENTEIHEDFESWTKTITVANTGTLERFVRVIVYAPSDIEVTGSGEGWNGPADGYYTYAEPIAPGATTASIDFKISGERIGDTAEEGENFNVIVIYESAPVLTDENGNKYADWSKAEAVSETEQGGTEDEEN